jgi:hypothetical protein
LDLEDGASLPWDMVRNFDGSIRVLGWWTPG